MATERGIRDGFGMGRDKCIVQSCLYHSWEGTKGGDHDGNSGNKILNPIGWLCYARHLLYAFHSLPLALHKGEWDFPFQVTDEVPEAQRGTQEVIWHLVKYGDAGLRFA